jgi:hypothetical protein
MQLMAKNGKIIQVQVDRAGKGRSPVRRVAVDIAAGCSIEISASDGEAVVRMSASDSAVTLATSGPHSDFARAINLLRLHLPASRA